MQRPLVCKHSQLKSAKYILANLFQFAKIYFVLFNQECLLVCTRSLLPPMHHPLVCKDSQLKSARYILANWFQFAKMYFVIFNQECLLVCTRSRLTTSVSSSSLPKCILHFLTRSSCITSASAASLVSKVINRQYVRHACGCVYVPVYLIASLCLMCVCVCIHGSLVFVWLLFSVLT